MTAQQGEPLVATRWSENIQNIWAQILHFSNLRMTNKLPNTSDRPPWFNLFYTITIQEQRSNGAWSYWEHKIAIPIPRGSSLISILWSTFAIFYVIPSSYPWLTWCWSSLRRSMLCKVFSDLRFYGRKYLFEHELFSREAVFLRKKKQQHTNTNTEHNTCRTGLEFRCSGGCSWPESHFHKSGFSWEIKQSWN